MCIKGLMCSGLKYLICWLKELGYRDSQAELCLEEATCTEWAGTKGTLQGAYWEQRHLALRIRKTHSQQVPICAQLKKKKKVGGRFQGEETRCAKQGAGVSKASENHTLLCSAPVHAGWAGLWLAHGQTSKGQCARQKRLDFTLQAKVMVALKKKKFFWKEYRYWKGERQEAESQYNNLEGLEASK